MNLQSLLLTILAAAMFTATAAATPHMHGDEDAGACAALRRTRSQAENAAAMAALARQLADMMGCEVGRAAAALERTGGEPEMAVTILLAEHEMDGAAGH